MDGESCHESECKLLIPCYDYYHDGMTPIFSLQTVTGLLCIFICLHQFVDMNKYDIASKDNADEDSADEGNGAEDDDGDYGGAEMDALLLCRTASIPTTQSPARSVALGRCRYYFRCDKKLQHH